MASLDSDKVRSALRGKLGCKEETGGDHYWYVLYDTDGRIPRRRLRRYDVGYVMPHIPHSHAQWEPFRDAWDLLRCGQAHIGRGRTAGPSPAVTRRRLGC